MEIDVQGRFFRFLSSRAGSTWLAEREAEARRRSLDAIEAALLASHVGQQFDAVVISAKESGGVIQLTEPVVTAAIEGAVTAGETVRATLVTADIATGTTLFSA